jgi:hypothetical protein
MMAGIKYWDVMYDYRDIIYVTISQNVGMFALTVRADANYVIIQKRSCHLTVDLATPASQNDHYIYFFF